jgi:hypothetical protein
MSCWCFVGMVMNYSVKVLLDTELLGGGVRKKLTCDYTDGMARKPKQIQVLVAGKSVLWETKS